MTLIVLLDSGPLGLVTNPKESAESLACKDWLKRLVSAGHQPLVPAITDYELRRELRLHGKINGLSNLDTLKRAAGYAPLTAEALLQAAEFWAAVRKGGQPTSDSLALDVDVILAAQAATLDATAWDMPQASVVMATMNVGHLAISRRPPLVGNSVTTAARLPN